VCNLYRLHSAPDAIAAFARELGVHLSFPEGVPNFQPRDVRISERAPILRAGSTPDAIELVERRWSWPGPTGKPVFNFRGEGRRFAPDERCVVLADGFYEFTAPADAKAKKKDRWLFTWPGQPWFGIGGIVRTDDAVGEAYTLLTCPPGPDIAPYHDRQIVLLSPADCLRWLNPAPTPQPLVCGLPEGTLTVEAA
jgi:putative SOS response-associated peptidase YedK